ncbi:MAG: nucleoside/nucleotide kinase family protein [Bacteroidota bacterium]
MKTEFPFLPAVLQKFSNTDRASRFLVGIVGAPASGKSYLSEVLPPIVNAHFGQEIATSMAMDGYHYYNEQLREKGIFPHKGSHFTFDVQAFTEKLVELKESRNPVSCPIYDRSIHDPTPDANVILPSHRLVFVEGNYLLSRVFPWITLRFLLDVCIFVEVEAEVQFQRLLTRHMAGGQSEQEAAAKARRTDLPNTELVVQDKHRADHVFFPVANRMI